MSAWPALENYDDYTTPQQSEALMSWLGSHGPDDRHLVVSAWNWDSGSRIVMWILRQPDCDRATALLAFWLSDPSDIFHDKKTYDHYESKRNEDRLPFCKEVLERWRSGFYSRSEILLGQSDRQMIQAFRSAFEENVAEFEFPELVWKLPPDFQPSTSGREITRKPPFQILPP